MTDAWCLMSKVCFFLKALQPQSRVWPEIIHRAPATSALHHRHNAHSLTSSRHDRHGAGQTCTQHCNSIMTARDRWEWHTHSFMLFPSFEIAIKADLIKPVRIIEVCWQGPDTLSFCANVSPEAQGILGYKEVMTETFVEDVNQTWTSCVSWCCMNAYRKQSCIYQSSVHTHLKQLHLSLSRSALVCLRSDLAYDECVLLFFI